MFNEFGGSNSDFGYDLQRYASYTRRRAAETAVRERYKAARLERVQKSERTIEARKNELKNIFSCVDTGLLLRRSEKVARSTRVNRPQNLRETVTRTEIVPMLPCKGYTLPCRNLFIGGKWATFELHEWKYGPLGLERLKKEMMMRINNISTSEGQKNQRGEPSELSDRVYSGDCRSHKIESGTQGHVDGTLSQIQNNTINNVINSDLGVEGVLWANETAYI